MGLYFYREGVDLGKIPIGDLAIVLSTYGVKASSPVEALASGSSVRKDEEIGGQQPGPMFSANGATEEDEDYE